MLSAGSGESGSHMQSQIKPFNVFDNHFMPNKEQERHNTHMHTIFGSVLWASCWSSDVFGVAMTMVTIVRQSISNVEVGVVMVRLKAGQEEVLDLFIVHFSQRL